MHVVTLVAAMSLLYLPGAHGLQESRIWVAADAPLDVVVAEGAVIRVLPYRPGSHCVHARAEPSEYHPATQSSHVLSDGSMRLPAGQSRHLVSPASEAFPLSQSAHEVLFSAFEYLPAMHGVHAFSEFCPVSLEDLPAAQLLH